VWIVSPLFIASTAPAPDTRGDDVVVISVNVTKGAADVDRVVALVREQDVDLLAVQEVTPSARDALREAGLDDVLPHAFVVPQPSAEGTGVWSRTPLTDERALAGFRFEQVVATTQIDGQRLTVMSVHARPPSSRLSGPWRDEQVRLAELVIAQGGPTLVVGDMNATHDHPEQRRIQSAGFAEARDQAGAGLVLTYPTVTLPVPVAGLERSLIRDLPWVATSVESFDVAGADHLAMVVRYATTASR
jgi:endonuclease/exonuclease/phosphatase (EEP) superfamily protein YafD